MSTILLHLDCGPNVASAAWLLYKSGLRTKRGEDGLDMTAGVRVSVVFAHLDDRKLARDRSRGRVASGSGSSE